MKYHNQKQHILTKAASLLISLALCVSLVIPAGGITAYASSEGTANIAQGAKLSEYYRQLEKYGQGGVKLLENGRYRFYGEITPATKAGQTAGRRVVREWFPVSHNKRTWMESIDHQGNVRVVRPETGGEKIHYRFDANGGFVEKF